MRFGIGAFVDDEGGYTTVAVATALLVSLTLVFSAAAAEWTLARSADVQRVADACAMAGENSVAAFCTIAQVLDACVLSMGIVGTLISGAGLVVSCVPGTRVLGTQVLEAGKKVLDTRRRFAESSMRGLERLERALPYLIVVNSGACVAANSTDGLPYVGCAIPFPQDSQSDYSAMDDGLDAEEMIEAAEALRDATERKEAARSRADAARERGWRADCVDEPSCLRSRAATLAGLGSGSNPAYARAELWNFGVPIRRSRAYYARRLSRERPEGTGIDAVTNSRCRKAFYAYALQTVNGAWYRELPDHSVDLSLPGLPHNTAEVRATTIYTSVEWPCTSEEGRGAVLHSDLSCPGASGPYVGRASLSALEHGQVGLCPSCRMSVGDMGRVAAISTNATNGYEHYWRIVVEASEEFEEARGEEAAAEREMEEAGRRGSTLFERALDELSVPRPKICPPGAYGCVAVVGRAAGTSLPSGLTGAFLGSSELPAGVAIAAACLAPDEQTDGNNVLSRFFDGITAGEGVSVGGLLGSITGVWGRVLLAYGSGYESVSGATEELFGKIDGVFGGTVGSRLSRRLKDIVERTGFEPVDMRLRKPVLVSTEDVLDRSGNDQVARARQMIQRLPDRGTPTEVAHAMGLWVYDQIKDEKITVAELAIPGTDITIPLTIDLRSILGDLT